MNKFFFTGKNVLPYLTYSRKVTVLFILSFKVFMLWIHAVSKCIEGVSPEYCNRSFTFQKKIFIYFNKNYLKMIKNALISC